MTENVKMITWMTGFGETVMSVTLAEITVNGKFYFVVEYRGQPRFVCMDDVTDF